ncbi:hypothetical protein L7F22_066158 [Adiantum nelumboides]|nr:hypothetical protein [Adiantum nelumboides]
MIEAAEILHNLPGDLQRLVVNKDAGSYAVWVDDFILYIDCHVYCDYPTKDDLHYIRLCVALGWVTQAVLFTVKEEYIRSYGERIQVHRRAKLAVVEQLIVWLSQRVVKRESPPPVADVEAIVLGWDWDVDESCTGTAAADRVAKRLLLPLKLARLEKAACKGSGAAHRTVAWCLRHKQEQEALGSVREQEVGGAVREQALHGPVRQVRSGRSCLHVAKDMASREEIKLPFFETFMYLKEREEGSEAWGFKCGYKRCIKERAMWKRLRPVSKEFKDLREVAMLEAMFAGSVGAEFPTDLPEF